MSYISSFSVLFFFCLVLSKIFRIISLQRGKYREQSTDNELAVLFLAPTAVIVMCHMPAVNS